MSEHLNDLNSCKLLGNFTNLLPCFKRYFPVDNKRYIFPPCSSGHIMSVTLHTDLGDIKLELFCEECPKACQNFLALCASGYYDDCIFHRVIKGFMLQTGDPTGTGKCGNSIWGKKFEDEIRDDLRHSKRGTLAFASNGPNTNASQFYITLAPQPHLDLKYTVFGRMIDGEDTLAAVEKLAVDAKYRPHKAPRVTGVTIHANPLAAG